MRGQLSVLRNAFAWNLLIKVYREGYRVSKIFQHFVPLNDHRTNFDSRFSTIRERTLPSLRCNCSSRYNCLAYYDAFILSRQHPLFFSKLYKRLKISWNFKRINFDDKEKRRTTRYIGNSLWFLFSKVIRDYWLVNVSMLPDCLRRFDSSTRPFKRPIA